MKDTPLHTAAWNGDTETLQSLIQGGIEDVNQTGYQGFTALDIALQQEPIDMGMVGTLLSADAGVNNIAGPTGTALHKAAVQGHAEAVNAILSVKGVNPNITNGRGETALDIAKRKGHVEVIQLLETFAATQGQSSNPGNVNGFFAGKDDEEDSNGYSPIAR